jgi:hypothetical protein
MLQYHHRLNPSREVQKTLIAGIASLAVILISILAAVMPVPQAREKSAPSFWAL